MYPVYPAQAQPNIKPAGFNGKLPLEQLMQIANEYKALGLVPVPRVSSHKRAYWKYWMAEENGFVRLNPTDENLRRDLNMPDIDGLILRTGDSLNGRLAVLDLDANGNHEEAEATYRAIQSLSVTNFVIATPSNGLHLYYRLPDEKPQLKSSNKSGFTAVDIRSRGGLLAVKGTPNQYTGDKAKHKGVEDGHLGYYRDLPDGDYTHIPVMSEALYEHIAAAQSKKKQSAEFIGAANYEKTDAAVQRLNAHRTQPQSVKEKLVIECLSHILPKWEDKSYDEYLQMWMAAFHGSDGSILVRDYIAADSTLWAGRSNDEVDLFIGGWNNHIPDDNGYTIASLLYLARQAGMGTQTGMELDPEVVTQVDVRWVTDWTQAQSPIPKHVLVKSQTGSGKTRNIDYLWHTLGKPKTVIFVPTTKLAIELANTLKNERGLPVTLYIDAAKMRTKDAETLVNAKVLVTTLQTFSTKVHSKIAMSMYGLVYFEESDQLFQQFARGEARMGGLFQSHITDTAARLGFAVIEDAFKNSENVWAVDATMTRVTYEVARKFTPNGMPISTIVNSQTTVKAPVTMVDTLEEAYQVGFRGILEGKRVVFVADTASGAKEFVKVINKVLPNKSTILITADTERDKRVAAFMEDVSEGAKQYDLVAYNSVMASGVSITGVKPDLIVQVCKYLSPRVNLQLLNRYREQEKVVVYYQAGENLYGLSKDEVLKQAISRASIEAGLMNMSLQSRDEDAEMRDYITALSIGDDTLQRKSARVFYVGLLKADGREVYESDQINVVNLVKNSAKGVREEEKARKEYIRENWQSVPPINRENPPTAEMDDITVALGQEHHRILSVLGRDLPEDVDSGVIYDVVHEFMGSRGALVAFTQQGQTLTEAQKYLSDSGRALTTFTNYVTMDEVVATLTHLYPTMEETISMDTLARRAPSFVALLKANADKYDAVITRGSQKFDEVYARSDDDEGRAIDFAKIILSKLGLKQQSKRVGRSDGENLYEYSIANLENAKRFLEWTTPEAELKPTFTNEALKRQVEAQSFAHAMYNSMSPNKQAAVRKIMDTEKGVTWEMAVLSVFQGSIL